MVCMGRLMGLTWTPEWGPHRTAWAPRNEKHGRRLK